MISGPGSWHRPLPLPSFGARLIIHIIRSRYFVVDIQVVRGAPQTATLPFAPYGSYFPEGSQVTPLAVRFQGEAEGKRGKGWRIKLAVDVPPK
jgi:hypothetical protein